jgi:hypothetical protein
MCWRDFFFRATEYYRSIQGSVFLIPYFVAVFSSDVNTANVFEKFSEFFGRDWFHIRIPLINMELRFFL